MLRAKTLREKMLRGNSKSEIVRQEEIHREKSYKKAIDKSYREKLQRKAIGKSHREKLYKRDSMGRNSWQKPLKENP